MKWHINAIGMYISLACNLFISEYSSGSSIYSENKILNHFYKVLVINNYIQAITQLIKKSASIRTRYYRDKGLVVISKGFDKSEKYIKKIEVLYKE